MGSEIFFGGNRITDGNAPHNDKFGDAANLDQAIEKARAAHQEAGGRREDVDTEDVVIVEDGQNLWTIWEQHAKDQGVSWDEFLQNNLHLQDPKNLGGGEEAGWNDWSLVHEGDAVFIPGESSGDTQPAVVTDGTHTGQLVKVHTGDWYFRVYDDNGEYSDVLLQSDHGQTLTYNGVEYEVRSVDHENDTVTVQEKGTNNTRIHLSLDLISQ